MRRRPSKRTGIPGAEKKLRQAEFFLRHLEYASHEIANEVARDPERLEFFFSACLTAAQSAHYVMASSVKDAKEKWENGLDPASARRFKWMIELRDYDVHDAASSATPQEKYIQERQSWDEQHAFLQHPAMFSEMPPMEEVNPDGQKVTGYSLRGTAGLYLEYDGRVLEATTVCREFIDLLRSLLEATRAAVAPSVRP
jgi:hypothetical protein